MSVAVTVVAPAAPIAVWRLWATVTDWPRWNSACIRAEAATPAAEGAKLDLVLRHPRGREFITRPTVTTALAGQEFTWVTRALGFRATTTTRFAAHEDGTLITLTALATGPLAFTYRMTMTDRTLALLYTRMLDDLVAELQP